MAHEFTTTRRVEFSETDSAGIVHFSNYFRYFESAEHAFFRSLGLRVHAAQGHAMQGWARVHASCDYLAPLRHEEEFEVHLVVTEKKEKSLTYTALVRRLDTEKTLVARGRWTVVFIRKDGDAAMRAAPMPREVDAAIEAAPEKAPVENAGRNA